MQTLANGWSNDISAGGDYALELYGGAGQCDLSKGTYVGDLLVTERTDPDWEPILKRASGVITNQGGRTCHAAIIAREMGITAIVGAGDATERIADGDAITASCCETRIWQRCNGTWQQVHVHRS